MRAHLFAAAAAAAVAVALAFAPVAAQAQAVTLSATLAGGSGGDTDGSGTASVKITGAEVCYELAVKDIAPATMAHIHKGAAGANGPVVVPFKAPDASGKVAACATANADAVKDILANPAGYYVNVHNADFPGGAIRGQLGK